jgi:hypothetical protein
MEADVQQFCEIKQFSKADRDAILARTRRGARVRNSEDVLTAIDDYLLTVRATGMAQGATA